MADYGKHTKINTLRTDSSSADFKEINKKPIEASEEEKKINPRAASAKLRVAEKI